MKTEANRRLDVDQGANPFTRYGFAGHTIKNPNITTTSTDKYSLQIVPVGVGKITTLRTKFEMILGKVWINTRGIRQQGENISQNHFEMHPMFKYLIVKLITYDSLYKIKQTQYKVDLLKELEDVSSQQQSEQQYYAKKKTLIGFIQDKLYDNHIKKQNGQSDNITSSRICKLQQYHAEIAKERQKYQQQYIEILRQKFKGLDFSFYLGQQESERTADMQWEEVEMIARKLCDSVDMIEPLKINQQVIRFKHFIKLNRPLFQTLTLQDKHHNFSFSIRKYTQEPQAVLHTVADFVFLRSKEEKDKVNLGVRMQLIKDIALAVKEYEKIVPQQMEIRRLYHYLNPHNIIFDQFSLQPKVRFEPALMQALGLSNKPLSIEARIAFFPTPQQFDFFQSLPQVHPETSRKYQLIRSDPLYGRLELHGQNRMKMSQNQVIQIKKEKMELQQEMQSILCWRFFLLSYYIQNSRQFGNSRKPFNEQQIRHHFVSKLQQKNRQLQKSKKNLSFFLGNNTIQDDEMEQFRMTFDGLMDYLKVSINDQLLQKHQYLRMKIYHNYRNILLREIIRILVADNVLLKMYNVKKYMCIFCIIASEILQESRTLLRCQIQRQGQRKNTRLAFDRDVKRLRNDKTYYSYLCSTFQSILKYQTRGEKDHQAYYIKQDKQGKQHLKQIKEMKTFMDILVREYSIKLDEAESRKPQGADEETEIKMKTKYLQKIKDLDQVLSKNFSRIKYMCHKIVFSQLQRGKIAEGKDDLKYHKLPQDDGYIHKSYALFNKKLVRTVQALYYFDESKLFNWESIVIPLLGLDNLQVGDKKVDIKLPRNEKELQEINKQEKNLEFLLQIFTLYVNQSKPKYPNNNNNESLTTPSTRQIQKQQQEKLSLPKQYSVRTIPQKFKKS